MVSWKKNNSVGHATASFKPGDIILWCDETYTVIENYGKSGKVSNGWGDIIDNFHWNCCGESAQLEYKP